MDDETLSQHEYTFGETDCEIHVEQRPNMAGGGPVFLARGFVWENGGKALREVGDRSGAPVHRASQDPENARQQMATYLIQRFGEPGERPQRHKGATSIRPINQPPL